MPLGGMLNGWEEWLEWNCLFSGTARNFATEPVEAVMEPMVMSFYHNLYCQQSPHGSFIMGIGHPDEPESLNMTSSWHFLEAMAQRVTKRCRR